MRRLAAASADPALHFLLLLPLALLHLSGRAHADLAAYGLVEALLRRLGPAAGWLLAAGLMAGLLWAIGRIRRRRLAWRGGLLLAAFEGVLWGLLLGPLLQLCLRLVSLPVAPLSVPGSAGALHGILAVAAGAGLYEELLFRAALLSACAALFARLPGLRGRDRLLSLGLAVLVTAALFSAAHALGDPQALEGPVFVYRFLAGGLLGVLYLARGLAVVAYAHATYDAVVMLWSSPA